MLEEKCKEPIAEGRKHLDGFNNNNAGEGKCWLRPGRGSKCGRKGLDNEFTQKVELTGFPVIGCVGYDRKRGIIID